MTDERAARIERLHREAPLTDVHVHPSLKTYLFGRNLWRHAWSGKTFDPFSSRSDFKMLAKGGVGVIWSSLHLPERQLFDDCPFLKSATQLFARKLLEGSPLARALEMPDAMEREIDRRPDRVELALSAADVVRIRAAGKLAVIHTVEGAHVLEGDPDNLEVLAERGVALLTLCHFYPNVAKMKTLPMIVDVSHCTPAARSAVYAELGDARPIVASHVGVTRYNPDPYNLADDEILTIAASGGAVGVIFMNYWLDAQNPKNGLDVIWKTCEHIHDVSGSWDTVVLGTDFDGFTDPPDDVKDASHLGRVTEMLLERGLTDAEVMKILGGNARRVLELGWR
jgi:microsomal dipeptidase-like Zn-dependent dipeptidase